MVKENITIEGARIVFRNFSGKEGRFNPPGKKNFCVLLDNELASNLKDDGWNVKWLKPREEDDEPQAYIQVCLLQVVESRFLMKRQLVFLIGQR